MIQDLKILLRGDADRIASWLQKSDPRSSLISYCAIIAIGSALCLKR
jgi:hypothetical protein